MDALSHYREAEHLLRIAADLTPNTLDRALREFERAQVHATLALAGVTALKGGRTDLDFVDFHDWHRTASVTAPIPPETDDEPEDDDTVRVGDRSLGSDAHPDALAAWLRALPLRTILRDVDGNPYMTGTGSETIHRSPDREFPALIDLGGNPRELTHGHDDVVRLSKLCAPFTVLALGDET